MISSIARLRLSAIAAFPPAPNWGPKGWGVDDPDSSTPERLSRRSRPLAAGVSQYDAYSAIRRRRLSALGLQCSQRARLSTLGLLGDELLHALMRVGSCRVQA